MLAGEAHEVGDGLAADEEGAGGVFDEEYVDVEGGEFGGGTGGVDGGDGAGEGGFFGGGVQGGRVEDAPEGHGWSWWVGVGDGGLRVVLGVELRLRSSQVEEVERVWRVR